MQSGVNPYLRTRIMTASAEELRLMLYDGAIRFCTQARQALDTGDLETAYNGLTRAQKIVLELSTSLDHKVAPELCERLSALYTYIYRLLVDANMERQTGPIDEALKLLQYERDTWQMLIQKLAEESGQTPAPGAQQTAMSSLSRSA